MTILPSIDQPYTYDDVLVMLTTLVTCTPGGVKNVQKQEVQFS